MSLNYACMHMLYIYLWVNRQRRRCSIVLPELHIQHSIAYSNDSIIITIPRHTSFVLQHLDIRFQSFGYPNAIQLHFIISNACLCSNCMRI